MDRKYLFYWLFIAFFHSLISPPHASDFFFLRARCLILVVFRQLTVFANYSNKVNLTTVCTVNTQDVN